MRTGPTSLKTRKLVEELKKLSKKNKAKIWEKVAKDIVKARRRKIEVNIFTLNKNTKKGEIVVVPGKLLGQGILDHSITVAALHFSQSAMKRINEVGKAITIKELMENNPNGKGVKVIG